MNQYTKDKATPNEYLNLKKVSATPMTRGEYNILRGWTLPLNENGEDKGYLLEHLDGSMPNHPSHTGFITWVTKEVFGTSYRLIPSVVEVPVVKRTPSPDITSINLEDSIQSENYFTAAEGCTGRCQHTVPPNVWVEPLNMLTFCVLVLKNGFTVTGESYCFNPTNFNAKLGREYAKKKAMDKLAEFVAYGLRTQQAG